jgi:hypothetical protein
VLGAILLLNTAGCSEDPVVPAGHVAAFRVSLREGNRVFFTAEESRRPDGALDDYVWDFGDGVTCPPDCGTTLGPTRTAHQYTEPGLYTVTLEVRRGSYHPARVTLPVQVGDTDLTSSWEQTYDVTVPERGKCRAATAADGFVLAGTHVQGGPEADLFLTRTDAAGAPQWQRSFGGADHDRGEGVLATSDGGFLLTGSYQIDPGGYINLYAVKCGAEGGILWERQLGGDSGFDEGRQVLEVDDGFVIAGKTYSYGPGHSAMWLVKLGLDGEPLWTRTFGGEGNDGGSSLAPAPDGGFLVAGITGSFDLGYQMYAVKTDAQGRLKWQRTYGGAGNERAKAVVALDEGYLLVGATTTIATSGNDNIYVVRIGLDGEMIWEYGHGSTADEFGHAALALPGGDVLVGGGKSDMAQSSGSPGWLLRLSPQGTLRWSSRLGDPDLDNGIFSLTAAADGQVVLGGFLTPAAGAERRGWMRKILLP